MYKELAAKLLKCDVGLIKQARFDDKNHVSDHDVIVLYDIMETKKHCSLCGGEMCLGISFNAYYGNCEYFCVNSYKEPEIMHAYLYFNINHIEVLNKNQETPIKYLQQKIQSEIEIRNNKIDSSENPDKYGKII